MDSACVLAGRLAQKCFGPFINLSQSTGVLGFELVRFTRVPNYARDELRHVRKGFPLSARGGAEQRNRAASGGRWAAGIRPKIYLPSSLYL